MLCQYCEYFKDEIKTPLIRQPKHCTKPENRDTFGLDAGGFITGTDIFHCDFFSQHHALCGDVAIITNKGGIISYVDKKRRKKLGLYGYNDNSKNINIVDEHGRQFQSHIVAQNLKNRDSGTFGAPWCPF